jgi:hypothetical protein
VAVDEANPEGMKENGEEFTMLMGAKLLPFTSWKVITVGSTRGP